MLLELTQQPLHIPLHIDFKVQVKTKSDKWWLCRINIKVSILTFDAKFGVPSELENNQHQEETCEGYSSDTYNHVHLQDVNGKCRLK